MNPAGPGESWLIEHIRFSVEQMDLSRVITMTGPPGSGKSFAGIRIGELLADGFSLDSIVFPGIDYLRKIADPDLKPGSIILWDDAGLGAPARQFWTILNQSVGLVAQSSRFRKLVVVCTLPDQSFLDAQPRKLTNLHLEFLPRTAPKSPAVARIYMVETSPKSGKIYYKHPRFESDSHGRQALEMVRFALPDAELTEAYQDRKASYMMAFYNRLVEQAESGGIAMDDYRARMLLLLMNYAHQLKKSNAQVARALSIHERSLYRAVRKAHEVTGLKEVS